MHVKLLKIGLLNLALVCWWKYRCMRLVRMQAVETSQLVLVCTMWNAAEPTYSTGISKLVCSGKFVTHFSLAESQNIDCAWELFSKPFNSMQMVVLWCFFLEMDQLLDRMVQDNERSSVAEPVRTLMVAGDKPMSSRMIRNLFRKLVEVESVSEFGDDRLQFIVTLIHAEGKNQPLVTICL